MATTVVTVPRRFPRAAPVVPITSTEPAHQKPHRRWRGSMPTESVSITTYTRW